MFLLYSYLQINMKNKPFQNKYLILVLHRKIRPSHTGDAGVRTMDRHRIPSDSQ